MCTLERRLCEYFIITGLGKNRKPYDLSQIYYHGEEIFKNNVEIEDLFKFKEPVVDIELVITQKEYVPEGFYLVGQSHSKLHKADLYGKASTEELFLCFRCGRDKPPITDILAFNPKEKSIQNQEGWNLLDKTISRNYSANLHSSTSNPLYLAYRRAPEDASVDHMAITDICIILNTKNERCPPAYIRMDASIKRTAFANSLSLCYKKSIVKERVLTYCPETIYSLPCTSTEPIVDVFNDDPNQVKLSDHLPPEIRDVANFCMPWGATIEAWPNKRRKPEPRMLTFVLTDDKYNRMYGSALLFYDKISRDQLSKEERIALKLQQETDDDDFSVYAGKSLCLLSQNCLTQTFSQVLQFLLQEAERQRLGKSIPTCPFQLPIERYLSQFMHKVDFPTPEAPNILLQWDTDNPIAIHLPHNALSQFGTGENLYHLIRLLDVDQAMKLFIYMLTEQKILLTSTCNSDLTGIAEALIATIFPFRWTVVYIPFLYLSCIHIAQSPAPYLIGVDSRFFDYFQLPEGVICLDLVTKSIKLPDEVVGSNGASWKQLDEKALPKQVLKQLRAGLSNFKYKVQIYEKEQLLRRTTGNTVDELSVLRKRETIGEKIRECFLRAVIMMFKNYQQYLIPLDRRRTTDDMFRIDDFLKSVEKNSRPLYQSIFDTQLWNNFILSRSQSVKFDDSLVFFDRCIKKLKELNEDTASATELLQIDRIIESEHTKVIEPPSPVPDWTASKADISFPNSLNPKFMLSSNHSNVVDDTFFISDQVPMYLNETMNSSAVDTLNNTSVISGCLSNDSIVDKSYAATNTNYESSIPTLLIRATSDKRGRRTPGLSFLKRPFEEIKQARQMAREAKNFGHTPASQTTLGGSVNPFMYSASQWASQLLVSSYCLWYLCLPGLVGHVLDTPGLGETGLADRILQLAMETLGSLSQCGIHLPDEVCCRIVMLLVHQLRPPRFRASNLINYTHLNAFSYALCNQITLEEKEEQDEEESEHQIPISINGVKSQQIVDEEDKLRGKPEKDCDSGRETLGSSNNPTEEATETSSNIPSTTVMSDESDNNKHGKIRKVTELTKPTAAGDVKDCKAFDSKLTSDGSSKGPFIEVGGKVIRMREKPQVAAGKKARHSMMFNHLPETIVSDDKQKVQYYPTAGIIMSSTGSTKQQPPKLRMYRNSFEQELKDDKYGKNTEIISSTESNTNKDINASNKPSVTNSPINTNPIGPAILFRSPFSEERSEIHQSFLLSSKKPKPIPEHQEATSESSLTGSEQVNDIIQSLHDCSTDDISSRNSVASSQPLSEERLTRSEFGLGTMAKTRASFRQMKSAANRSWKQMRTLLSNANGNNWVEGQTSNSAGDGGRFSGKSVSGGSTGKPGLPNAYKPWNSSGSKRSSQQQQQGKVLDGDHRTGSVDLLDTVGGIGGGINKASRNSMYPGLATVQQPRRQQYNQSRTGLGKNYYNYSTGAMTYWDHDVSNSNESVHSDKSMSSTSQESELISLNLDKAWEQITGALEAIRLPIGKYWSCDSSLKVEPSSLSTNKSNSDIATDNHSNEPMKSTQDVYLTRECTSSLYIHMTTGTNCPNCSQVMFDDNIMDSWSYDDSNHQAVCFCCGDNITPKLQFQVYIVVPSSPQSQQNTSMEDVKSVPNYKNVLAYKYSVNYLSPFVVRKELESVLEQEGEYALLSEELLPRHDILYWNLIWYFSRLGLPSHLFSFLTRWLHKRGVLLTEQNKDSVDDNAKSKYQILLDLTGYEQVSVNTLWEFSQLSSRVTHSLYREYVYFRQMQHVGAMVNAHIAYVNKVVMRIYEAFYNNDLLEAIICLLEQRKNRWDEIVNRAISINSQTGGVSCPSAAEMIKSERSLYRELFFLILVSMDSNSVNFDVFHLKFDKLWSDVVKRYPNLLGPQDKCPTFSTLFCRKVFRSLML